MVSEIKQNVLRRVKIIFYLRKLLNPFSLEVSVFAITLISLLTLTSVSSIFNNFIGANGLSGIWKLTLSALTDTETTIQFIFAFFILSLAFIAKDIVQRRTFVLIER